VVRRFKLIAIVEAVILLCYFVDFTFFINLQVAALSSFLIILASAYTHKKMVQKAVQNGAVVDDRDMIEKIEDPFELYDDTINEAPVEELDIKAIIKEEKQKQKILSVANLRQGMKGTFSLWRMGGYLFLVMGFIALKNNNLLEIKYYLPSLLVGIITASLFVKEK